MVAHITFATRQEIQQVRNTFWLVTEVAVRVTFPFSLEKVVLGKNCIILNQPHENFDFSSNGHD
jgi:hypothetical protein